MQQYLIIFFIGSIHFASTVTIDRPIQSKDKVFSSLRKSLIKSIPGDQQFQLVSEYLSQSSIIKLENFVQNSDLIHNVEEFKNLSKRNLSNDSVLDFIECILKAILSALEENLKEEFVALMEPLLDLTLALHPLPHYRLTLDILDGNLPMRYIEETFDNWGSTLLANVTVRTFFPRTVSGIQNIIKSASSIGARVRASGTRHTFNPWLWGVESNIQPGTQGHNTDYVIAMLPLSVSDRFAYHRDHGDWPEDSGELVRIDGPLKTWIAEDGRKRASVKFGAGTLNLHYYDWAVARNWTMPANTIMHYMSMGGVAMGTCHGGGIGHKTIADRIIEMEYVDSQGVLQTISDPEQLKVAAGSMGLLGIVTSITYELDEMTFAKYQPRHAEGGLTAFLPPPGEEIPAETLESFNHYFSEFIQYVNYGNASKLLWLMTFDNNGKAEDSVEIIDQLENEFQEALIFGEEVAKTLLQMLMEFYDTEEYMYWVFGWITGNSAYMAMPDLDTPITTTVTQAMHFQRGLHYLIVKAAEMIVPIPVLENGEYDWRVIQEVVYDIKRVHEDFVSRGLYPVDYAFEARLMSGSDLVMSSQYGNQASLAIEIASSDLVPQHVWDDFKNALAANWRNYKDKDGNVLTVRPHWAKEFPLEVDGQDIYDYMREVYRDQIPLFVDGVNNILIRQNGNLTNTVNMFSTKYLDMIFEGYF